MSIYVYFLLFIIYSFIGWLLEVITEYIHKKRFVNRGFLIGPYCPIYGFAALSMIILLRRYLKDPVALFIMAIVICSIMEYFTSYVMEKLFHAKWWDYSNNKFNINGRICLETMIPFGIGGLLLMYFINPFIVNCLNMLPLLILKIVAIVIFIIFLLDNIVSFKVIAGLKNYRFTDVKDSTAEITKIVKDKILKSEHAFTKRLIKAFPNIKIYPIKKKNKKQ